MNTKKAGVILDPFAFPPETNTRFNLLIFGAVITVFSLSITMWATLTLGSNLSRIDLTTGERIPLESRQIILFVIGAPIIGALSVLVLLGLAYYKYRQHPDQIIAQKRLELPDPGRDSKFIESLASLARDAGLPKLPEVMLGPPRSQDGQAFGFRDRPILRLGSSLKVMRLKEDLAPIYRAITLHEMAHIYNEDVQRSYFAEAMWSALRIVIVPITIVIVLGYIPAMNGLWPICIPLVLVPVGLFIALEVTVILAMLQFIRRGALRIREIYADLRAARWGAYAGLVRILSSAREVKLSWWKRLWEYHPKASDRLRFLQDSERIFRLTLDLPLSIGFLVGIVLAAGSTILVHAARLRETPSAGYAGSLGGTVLAVAVLIYFGSTFLVAWLMASGIGLQVQRQTSVDWVQGRSGFRPYVRLFLPALIFQLAFEAGVYLMPYEAIQIDPSGFLFAKIVDPASQVSSASLISFLIFPFWILFTAITTWLWMGLIRFYAGQLIGWSSTAAPSPVGVRSVTIIATLILPLLYIPPALARYWLLDIENRSVLPAVVSLPVIFLLVLLICLVGWLQLKRGQNDN